MAPGKGIDEAGHVMCILILHRQCCHLQPDRPSLRARLDRRYILRGQHAPDHLPEEGSHLLSREAQVRATQLVQLPSSAQAAQRKGRIHPAGYDQVHLRRLVAQ